MIQLNTRQVYVSQGVPPPPPPLQHFTFPKPLSYEFRVAEHLDEEDKIIRVGLQVQIWEHDESGFGTVKQSWTDAPRVQLINGVVK